MYKDHAISKRWGDNPIILYGLEFMYSRDPLEYSRGKNKEKGIDQFIAKVIQDADKLIASKNMEGFMGHVKMLTFVKESSKEIWSYLKEKLSSRNEILLCFG